MFKDLENRCYQCGQTGHYKSECKSRPLSSRPQERALEPVKEDVSEKLDQIKCTRIHSVGRGIVVPVNVNNKECSGVIDTGADATVISSAHARDARIDISNCKKARLMIAENGAEMTAFGGVTATIQIGSHTTKWKVYVAPIRDSVLIGMDLLNSLDAVIHTGQGNLWIEQEIISGTLSCDGNVPACNAVSVYENCLIPPESESIIIGRVQLPQIGAPAVLNGCDDELPGGILVGSCQIWKIKFLSGFLTFRIRAFVF